MTSPRNPHARAIVWCAVSTVSQAEPEHYSLDAQEKDGRALADTMGWRVTDVMRVPGHSRARRNLDALAIEASDKGIHAFQQLLDHLTTCDFDVLICRDANRFARKSSMLHQIVEMVYEDCGGYIHSLTDGEITVQNWPMWAAMKGYQSAAEWRWIRDAFQRGAEKLTERGLGPGPMSPLTHRRIRDPKTGKQVGHELDPRVVQVMHDAAEVLLDGVSWMTLGDELYKRFGHTDDSGRPWLSATLYNLFLNPMTYGHKAFRHTTNGQYGKDRMYILDDRVPPPPKVKFARNVVPPVFEGELADRVKAEIIRRTTLKGKSDPSKTFRYSGLCRCGYCGGTMNAYVGNSKTGPLGLRCMWQSANREWRKKNAHMTGDKCPQKHVNVKYLDPMFRLIVAQLATGVDFAAMEGRAAATKQANADKELEQVRAQVMRLIEEQSLAPASAQPIYREKIATLATKAEQIEVSMTRLRTELRTVERRTSYQREIIKRLRDDPESFWQRGDTALNQDLRGLLDGRRVIIKDFEFVGLTDPEW
jgi:DNA invertase Pin-like site-specific DNA recombinase